MKLHPAFIVLSIAFAGLLAVFVVNTSEPQKLAAGRQAQTVVPPPIDDETISAAVRSAFLADPELSDLGFRVKTRRGKVELNGYIETQPQIDRVLVVTRGVAGVKGIRMVIGSKDRTVVAADRADGIAGMDKAKLALLGSRDGNIRGKRDPETITALPEYCSTCR